MNPPPTTNELEAVLGAREFLRRLARGLVLDEHRAEDLVQETCARALEQPPRQRGALRRWMASVLRNLALDEGLRERARPAVEARAAKREAVWEAEERDLELEASVLAAVRGLRQPYRTTIYLRYYRGLSPQAIARRLGEPVATVKTRLRRGLEQLRAELDRRHGGDRRAWCAALVVLALPELVGTGAGALSAGAALTGTALKGIALMNKPLTVTLAAVALAALATVAWNARDAGGPAAAEPERAIALSPDFGPAPAAPLDDEREAETEVGARAEAAQRALASASAPELAAAPRTGLFGRVIDESGRPVAGADVRSVASELSFLAFDMRAEADAPPAQGQLTDAEGRFRLPVAEDGPLSLVVAASGFAPFRKEVTGYYDMATDVGDLSLSTGVVLAGRVVDVDGAPVAGARVSTSAGAQSANVIVLGGGSKLVAVTDASGRFELDRHAVGAWNLSVRSDLHPEETLSGETAQPGERVDGLEVVLRDGARISGRLTGAPGDRPVELWVLAERADKPNQPGGPNQSGGPMRIMSFGGLIMGESVAAVGADGRFVLTGLEPGARYRLLARDSEDAWGGRARSRTVEADAGASEVELPWSTGAAIRMQCIDARSGQPIEDYRVEAGLGWAMSTPDDERADGPHPEGRALIDDLHIAEGSESAGATVRVRAPGYAPWERDDITVQRDREHDLGVVRLEPVPMARITVLDDLGHPVVGAQVRLRVAPAPGQPVELNRSMRLSASRGSTSTITSPAAREGRTDENGVARFSSMPGERAFLSVAAVRFADWRSEELELPARDELVRTVTLERGAIAELLVVDAAGAPLPGARVQHRALVQDDGPQLPGLPSTTRVTDSEGRVYFRNLRAGKHGFRLDDGKSASFVMQRGAGARASAAFSFGGAETPFNEYELAAGETRTITLAQGVSTMLAGRVTEDSAPLAGAELRLVADGETPIPGMGGGGPRATTDERGNYSFDSVEPGKYELVVSHATRALEHREAVELRAGGDRLDVDLDVTILAGRVEDRDGRPIAGAKVSAERVRPAGQRRFAFTMITADGSGGSDLVVGGGEGPAPVLTDADGNYELRGVPSGVSIRVRAEAADHTPANSEAIELESFEKRAGFDLALRPGGALAIQVLRADGSPAARAMVRLKRLDQEAIPGPPQIKLTDADGRGSFRDLDPGRYTVTAAPIGVPGGEVESPELLVIAGEETPVRIDLP